MASLLFPLSSLQAFSFSLTYSASSLLASLVLLGLYRSELVPHPLFTHCSQAGHLHFLLLISILLVAALHLPHSSLLFSRASLASLSSFEASLSSLIPAILLLHFIILLRFFHLILWDLSLETNQLPS